ncbi:c factor cell-cell signaling protein [Moniliophthora roreri MCA 2997]|uniref:C factor cell-cell signaling protein n=2 Tax=Moniliophthora roreri TaxID=221103 RepID=V2XY38_MONRO|nr:c factor cell-cell signaling protein [Moniliophthora roreri MCA 2997]KAI3612502.1 c factor cell-cell signaling protein [Moniliophthora roreri]
MPPFILITPATRGLSLALTRNFLRATNLPVYATHRSGSPEGVKEHILSPLKDIDPNRLHLLHLDLTKESTIEEAAGRISKDSTIHTAFLTGGILHPEKSPEQLDFVAIKDTFDINVISHLLLIKHFSRFLPTSGDIAKWVHISARVGSISDNKTGGWYSYRASKAALNQVIKTLDVQLKMKGKAAMAVGMHPGTVKTDLSREFWSSVPKEKLFEPEYAAEKLIEVVNSLKEEQRGCIWDWAGKRVDW